MNPDEFRCPKCTIGYDTDDWYCTAIGGGFSKCNGKSPNCRIRLRKMRRAAWRERVGEAIRKRRGIETTN